MAEQLPRPIVQPPSPWALPKPTTAVLDNGLRVIAFQHDGQHVISADLTLDLPLSCEPWASEGVAAIVADTLSEGTGPHTGNSFAEAIENLGASLGAAAGQSASQVTLDVPSPNLEEALRLMARLSGNRS
jgi:predicted Zn-dependent peptidase